MYEMYNYTRCSCRCKYILLFLAVHLYIRNYGSSVTLGNLKVDSSFLKLSYVYLKRVLSFEIIGYAVLLKLG